MKRLKLIKQTNATQLVKRAAFFLNYLFEKYQNQPILFLTSGGSALSILALIDTSFIKNNCTITVLDERYSHDTQVNNFSLLAATDFYKKSLENKAQFIDTRVLANESMQELATRFDTELKIWKQSNPKGHIIATQGIGPDGHTAGIMPFPEDTKTFKVLFQEQEKWVTAYDAKDKNSFGLRVTTTIPFLETIDYVVVYAIGENKRQALKQILSPLPQLNKVPGSVIRSMRNASLFTDLNI